MNIGGDPGQDDDGLPPVDIEIPDDARELDRDVLAYHRELRALRRHDRARRLSGPLIRDGLVLPLIAGCLALTLLAGTLLTVFTNDGGPFGPVPGARTAPSSHPSLPGRIGKPLPDVIVTVDGQRQPLRGLAGAVRVLALIPLRCQCLNAVRELTVEASQGNVQIYLVGAPGAPVLRLSRRAGLGMAHAVVDSENALPPFYHPAALMVMVVRADGIVAGIVNGQGHGVQLRAALKSAGAG